MKNVKSFYIILAFLFVGITARSQSWSELGTGTNALKANSYIFRIAVDTSGNVYAAGNFRGSDNFCSVAKWDGASWSQLGTGANALNAEDGINSVAMDKAGVLYVAGKFPNRAGKQYVAKWDGTVWSELGTGTNALKANNAIHSIAVDKSGNVYAVGRFTNGNKKPYVAKWDGTTWSELGAASNAINTDGSIQFIAVDDVTGNVYIAAFIAGKYYINKWDGRTWSEVGTGANALKANNTINSIIVDNAGNVYAAGGFTNSSGTQYVAKWDGTTWSELGTGANALRARGYISSIAMDNAGNVYAAGGLTNNSGTQYVGKWDGTTWSEVGTGNDTLKANGTIYSVAIGGVAGNVYAAGDFTNSSGNRYVAKYGIEVTIDSIDVRTVSNVPATITTNGGTLPMTAAVFPVAAIQNVTWSIVPGTGTATINATGIVTAQSNGTVYAKAVSVVNTAKMDSLLVTISNQVAVPIDSIEVRTVGNAPATIRTNGGTLTMEAVVFPATAYQNVTWSIVPRTGTATINATGVITAQSNGTVYAKAVSVANTAKMDSLLVTISNQAVVPIDSIEVRTVGNVPATIRTNGGTLTMEAVVFPAAGNQNVTWSIVPGTGTATINAAGVMIAQSEGTVFAKAVSVTNRAKMDSLLVTISNQEPNKIYELQESIGFKLYPNPANEEVLISVSKVQGPANITLTDIAGRVLIKRSFAPEMLTKPTSLSLKGIPPGLYFMRIKISETEMSTKLIKR